jgi:hypothetical protein
MTNATLLDLRLTGMTHPIRRLHRAAGWVPGRSCEPV